MKASAGRPLRLLQRAYRDYGDPLERLATLSVSHLYNPKGSAYRASARNFTKTRPVCPTRDWRA
ncbi:MAG: hypothetical protein IPL11_03605 [Candidatus Accumulibacter sp.]|nr:hypothetical protein [Accumulibacter sp.]